jgi:hypothetical protein
MPRSRAIDGNVQFAGPSAFYTGEAKGYIDYPALA